MAERIRYYLDENMPIAVATQLQRRGIDVVTVRNLGYLGDSDIQHLHRATQLGRVLCTHDADYVYLAPSGVSHADIVFGQQHQHGVGDWVQFLELLTSVLDAGEMYNRVEYV